MMPKSKSKRLVIDASVARAAGGTTAQHPRSVCCRKFLVSVLTICHIVVENSAIMEEWNQHRSRFASTWRTQMKSRKKIARIDTKDDPVLRAKVTHDADDKEREAMLKDFHLLEAALSTDKVVISLDNRVRALYAHACTHAGEVSDISWVDPTETPETVDSWLEGGCKSEQERHLRNYKPSSENE